MSFHLGVINEDLEHCCQKTLGRDNMLSVNFIPSIFAGSQHKAILPIYANPSFCFMLCSPDLHGFIY